MKRRAAVVLGLIVVVCVVAIAAFATPSAGQYASQNETGPNDNRSDAMHIQKRTFIQGETSDSDDDWFAFDAQSDQAIRVTTEFGGQYARVTLYGPNGKVLGNGSTGGTEDAAEIGAIAAESGTYHLRVAEGGEYPIQYGVKVATETADRLEPDGDRDAATLAEPNRTYGMTVFQNDEDWYAVDLNEDENLTTRLGQNDTGAEFGQNVGVDIYAPNGSRVGEDGSSGLGNTTELFASNPEALQQHVASRAGTYYVRVAPAQSGAVKGFTGYELSLNTTDRSNTEPRSRTDSLVIVGGSAENKVTYAFTHDGTVERSGESHGAPIDDDAVTIDTDVDTVSDGRVDGRLGGGGDAYLVQGNVTGLRLDGNATVYRDGIEVDPTSFGPVAARDTTTVTSTATPTATSTATMTPTRTATAARTPTSTATPPPTATTTTTATATPPPTATATPTATGTAASTTRTATNANGSQGEIVGGAETEAETTTEDGPGFGALPAVIAVVAAGLVALRRR
ncbi:PGF-CTERM sorting domain-containing protein [Halococcus sp. IIIV-5B]|uniref:PGF-CTERM sorting domain-containing protein n=1 Tax=Halococcus sp. IIIV-5B TaxID=2321230 RepID=UPI000E7675FE|nr:PGF-CTERM sorting domain-containing protein [Halococcus sp. IIIV-5B]RJT00380.1 PGF-CTERM sorting domain-containing protein [Halococcus sp. IIIV-5B]